MLVGHIGAIGYSGERECGESSGNTVAHRLFRVGSKLKRVDMWTQPTRGATDQAGRTTTPWLIVVLGAQWDSGWLSSSAISSHPPTTNDFSTPNDPEPDQRTKRDG